MPYLSLATLNGEEPNESNQTMLSTHWKEKGAHQADNSELVYLLIALYTKRTLYMAAGVLQSATSLFPDAQKMQNVSLYSLLTPS